MKCIYTPPSIEKIIFHGPLLFNESSSTATIPIDDGGTDDDDSDKSKSFERTIIFDD